MSPSRAYIQFIREQWAVIIVVGAVCLLSAGIISFLTPPRYTAKITLYVSAQNATANTQGAFQGAQLSQQRVTSYVELVRSSRVTSQVIRDLNLDETPEALAANITATSTLDSVLIDISAEAHAPQLAAQIANAVGSEMTRLVAELEQPAAPDGAPQVQVRTVQPAEVPDSPSSAGLSTYLAIGSLLGLAVGTLLAALRSALDISIRTQDQVTDIAGAPILGSIAFDSSTESKPVAVRDAPLSPRAEAYRQLRTNLQFIDLDEAHRVFTVTSSLPTERKSTTVANLAATLSATGARVLVIAADLRKPSVARILGLHDAVGLTTVLTGRVSLKQAIQQSSLQFDLLASGQIPPNPSELLGSHNMRRLIAEVRQHYDFVLVDTPPLLPVADAAAVAPSTDGVLMVVRYQKTTRTQLASARSSLDAVGARVTGTIFSMVPRKGPTTYSYYGANPAGRDANE